MNFFKNIFNSQPVRRVNPALLARANRGIQRPIKIHPRTQVVQTNQRTLNPFEIHRLTSDWLGDAVDVNQILRSGLVRARARSREITRIDGYPKKYLRMLEKNIVGPDGFTLRNKAGEFVFDDKKKKYKYSFDKSANSKIFDAFSEWSKLDYCTVTEDISFRETCSLIVKTIATDGEILVREHKGYDNKFGFALQLIPADYLDESFNAVLQNGDVVIMGVQKNKLGKTIGFWLRKTTPTHLLYGAVISSDRFFVNAKDPVYGNTYHLFVKESVNQVRGIPWFVPAMVRLKMLAGYEEAVLVDARLTANKTIALQRKDGIPVDNDLTTVNAAGVTNATTDSVGNAVFTQPSSPGETWKAPDGYEVVPVDFKSPSGKEGDFTKTILRGAASALDVSYIALANDYEGVNYTSSRTNLLEERDTWKTFHSWFREHFLLRFYPNWLEMALLKRAVQLPAEKFERFNKGWFSARGWQWVSPKDEAEAFVTILSNNIGSLDEILAATGWSLEEFVDQLVYEKELFADNGLEWPGSGRMPAAPLTKEEPAQKPKNGKAKIIDDKFLIEA